MKIKYFLCCIFYCIAINIAAQDRLQSPERIDSLKKILATAEPDTNKVLILTQLAQELRRIDTKQIHLQEALKLAETLKYHKGTVLAYNVKGIIARDSSKYPIAIDIFTKGIELAKNLPEKAPLAEMFCNLGSVYRRLDEYEKSLNYYLQALQIAETYKDNSNYSRALNGLGNNYRQLKNFTEAIKYFEKALDFERKNKNIFGISVNLNNLGKVYFDLGEYDKSMPLMQEALQLNEEMKNDRGLTSCLNTIGEIYHQRKEYSKALENFKKALVIDERLGDRRYLIDSYTNFGELYTEIGNYQLGIDYINKALKLGLEINTKSKVQAAYEHLYSIYKKTGDSQKALLMYEKAINYKDSILNEKNQESIAKMQSMFDKERSEAKIQLLEKDKRMQVAETSRNNNLMMAVVIFLVAIAVIFYVNYLSKKKANDILQNQNKTIQQQSEVITKINQDWQSSVTYAKRIQEAMLPHRQNIGLFLSEYFIYFRPKDIVSGDIYWFYQIDAFRAILACVDCTGHGVPGAFMSMLANASLSKIVENQGITNPSEILNQLHLEVVNNLNQNTTENRDGMEMNVCLIDKQHKTVTFAGAVNPIICVENGNLTEIKGDKLPIGGMQLDEIRNYTSHTIEIKPNANFYIFTDGYQDQFGGDKDKKFMIKRMRTMFLANHNKSMEEQEQAIETTMKNWMENSVQQIDDMLVVGFRVD